MEQGKRKRNKEGEGHQTNLTNLKMSKRMYKNDMRRIAMRVRNYNIMLLGIVIILAIVVILTIHIISSKVKEREEEEVANKIFAANYLDDYKDSGGELMAKNGAIELGDDIWSKYVMMYNITSDSVICKKKANERAYPASLTKIMTAIIAIEGIPNIDAKFMMTPVIFDTLYEENSSMAGFRAGEEVTIRDLLYGTLLPSGGEAAVGLAIATAGTVEEFVGRMNLKAEKLGLKDTAYVNVTGLHNEGHYTTASDMVKLIRYAIKNETFREIFTSKTYTTTTGLTFSHTMFAALSECEYDNKYIIGGKTGYTLEGRLCLASLAKIGKNEYILVTMGAGEGSNEPAYHILDAINLYSQFEQ